MEQLIQLGSFIRDMRMEQGLTQQQLADRLGVTDKAVSKWERDICCPDITLLRPLSAALGVTVSELLAGSREPGDAAPAVEDVVVSAISYSESARRKNRLDWRLLTFMGLTAACIIAAATCLICDLAVNGRYTWSPPVYPSIGLAWLVCSPLLLARHRPVRWALVLLTVSVLPYLCGLGWMLGKPLVTKMSIWIAPVGLVYLWLVYAICLRLRQRAWRAAGWIFLLAVPLAAGINFLVDRYVGSSGYHDVWIGLLCAGGCFAVDYALERRGAGT